MRNTMLLLFVGISLTNPRPFLIQKINRSEQMEIKNLLLGKWVQNTDHKFKMVITQDYITYYYNKKMTDKNKIWFVFRDSLNKYKTKSNEYDFMRDGLLHEKVVIKEAISLVRDTIFNRVIFIDNSNLELDADGRDVSFHKIKKNL